jgi:multiple sugar transport system substrate-binding protein
MRDGRPPVIDRPDIADVGSCASMGIVRYLAPDTDAYVASVQRHAPEFEAQTGHRLEVRVLASDEYFSNRIGHLLAGDDAADVFMSGPVLLWEHVGAGLVEPLDEHLAEVHGEFDLADFLPRLLEVNRWSGHAGDPLGTGPLLEIPVNCESYNLAFVPHVLAERGLDVPQTWADYFAVARDVARGTDGEIRGFGQRGRGEWHTMYTGFATQLWSCGGRDFDPDGRAAFADADAVEVTVTFIQALRDAGPLLWTQQRWYELALDFGRGRYALLVDSDHYVAFFEDERHSELVGRIGYALPPAGPAGERRPNLWTWSLAMTAASRDKRAASDFITWAASKPFLLRSAAEGNMNPTRRSTWDDPGFQALTAPWGDFAAVSRRLLDDHATVLVTPTPQYREIALRWTEALRQAYAGRDVGDALRNAAADAEGLFAGSR